MEFKDYYETLGVKHDASPEEVKRVYRRLARKFHPDVSKEPDAEGRFKEVQEAYSVLKDPEKRKAYDRFGKDWKAGQEFRPPPDWDRDFAGDGGSFADGGEFSDFFESLFGRARPRAHWQSGDTDTPVGIKGQNLHARISLPVEDTYHGVTRSLTVEVPSLDAAGYIVNRPRTLNVRIPKGVTSGQRIRLAGQGEAGIGGAPAGDLFLQVSVTPHRIYRTEGRDIYLDLPIAPWEAALGRTVEVPTLGGKVELKIPAGSQSGTRLRLKGRGLPGSTPGDQYVVFNIVVPKADTDAARALYERMEREMGFDPRAELKG